MVHRGHGIGPMELGVTRSGEGYECVCRSGVRFVVASVVQERSAQYAADLWNEPGSCRHPSDRLRFVDSASRSRYLDACGRILGAVAEQPGLLGDQRTAALLEERFLEGLFLNAHGAPPGASDRRFWWSRPAWRCPTSVHLTFRTPVGEGCLPARSHRATADAQEDLPATRRRARLDEHHRLAVPQHHGRDLEIFHQVGGDHRTSHTLGKQIQEEADLGDLAAKISQDRFLPFLRCVQIGHGEAEARPGVSVRPDR